MKAIKSIVVAIFAVLLVSSCGVSSNLAANKNLNQTNVVLSQNNFEVVKTVSAEVSATYVFGLGGIGKRAMKANAVAELTKEAGLTGSQALVNITVKQSGISILGVYSKMYFIAEGTVIEFKD